MKLADCDVKASISMSIYSSLEFQRCTFINSQDRGNSIEMFAIPEFDNLNDQNRFRFVMVEPMVFT